MHWQEIAVTTTEIMEEAVVNLFYEIGAAGVVIEDPNLINRHIADDVWDAYEFPQKILETEHVVVKGYLPVNEQLPLLLEQFNGALAALSSFFEDYFAQVQLLRVKEQDWANSWKDYYKPFRISNRIVVSPSWEEYKEQDGTMVIRLDPGMAFGTGTHPTTIMCIKALEKYLKPGLEVADVGTGSGILAIAAAKLGANGVLAVDLDTLAVRMATLNVQRNMVEGKVKVLQNNLLHTIEGPFDVIVANIVADVIIEMAEDAINKLSSGGILIASGIIEDRLSEVSESLLRAGSTLVEILDNGLWRGIVVSKG
ncbi:MAG: 50S ribosomal protein L11 methyltransferase [Bacillota bacterium]